MNVHECLIFCNFIHSRHYILHYIDYYYYSYLSSLLKYFNLLFQISFFSPLSQFNFIPFIILFIHIYIHIYMSTIISILKFISTFTAMVAATQYQHHFYSFRCPIISTGTEISTASPIPPQKLHLYIHQYHQTNFILILTPYYNYDLKPIITFIHTFCNNHYRSSYQTILPFLPASPQQPPLHFSSFFQSSFSITTPQPTAKRHINNTSISNHFWNASCQTFDNEVVPSATRDIHLKNSKKGFMQTRNMLSVLCLDAMLLFMEKKESTPLFHHTKSTGYICILEYYMLGQQPVTLKVCDAPIISSHIQNAC